MAIRLAAIAAGLLLAGCSSAPGWPVAPMPPADGTTHLRILDLASNAGQYRLVVWHDDFRNVTCYVSTGSGTGVWCILDKDLETR